MNSQAFITRNTRHRCKFDLLSGRFGLRPRPTRSERDVVYGLRSLAWPSRVMPWPYPSASTGSSICHGKPHVSSHTYLLSARTRMSNRESPMPSVARLHKTISGESLVSFRSPADFLVLQFGGKRSQLFSNRLLACGALLCGVSRYVCSLCTE